MFHEARRSIDEPSIKISLNEILYFSIPVIVFLISTLYWGNILWWKYSSLHDYVLDSGIFLDSLYQIFYFHTSTTLISYLGSGPDRIIFSPLSYFHSILFLLYFQLIAVLGTTFIVFFTVKTLTKNSVISSVVSVLYLLYFPIDGSLFFDVHAQTFFIPFFLLGFMFQAMNKKYLSILFFLLAGMTRFPLIGIVLIYAILDFLRNYRLNWKNLRGSTLKPRLNFDIFLFGASFTVFLLEYLIEHDLYGVHIISQGYLHVSSSGILSNLSVKVITVFFFAAPFLFLILYVNEFSLILWGMFGFIFYANYTPYYYPGIFTHQYSAIFTAIIFLIIMVYLADSNHKSSREVLETKTLKYKLTKLKRSPLTKIAISVLIFAILMEPMSPVSASMGTSFNLNSYISFGNSNSSAVMQMADLIPSGSSGVIIQSDLPQVLTHDYNINPNLLGEVIGYPLNYTSSYFANASSIEYIFGYMGTQDFSYSDSGLSQYTLIQNALSSGKYGLLGENGQLLLFERGYTALPEIFSHAESLKITSNNLISLANPRDNNGTLSEKYNSISYDSSFYLMPGEYNLKVSISPISVNLSGSIDIQIYGHLFGKDNFNQTLSIRNGVNNYSIMFNSGNLFLYRYLSIYSDELNGTMRIDSITMNQIN